MAKSHDNLLMLAAVAVTALICISGMYLMLSSGGHDQDVRVTVPSDISSELTAVFKDFETYASVNLIVSDSDDPSFGEHADVVITNGGPIAEEGVESIGVTISDVTVYINFRSGTSGTAGAFINWLASQGTPGTSEKADIYF
ncbi:MAG: hypothetical protein FWH44_00980 [Methanomassiliicoccaceae archaeon]|nr:hypothetical protein [Methanomassiliicoccaceae archaeon]